LKIVLLVGVTYSLSTSAVLKKTRYYHIYIPYEHTDFA